MLESIELRAEKLRVAVAEAVKKGDQLAMAKFVTAYRLSRRTFEKAIVGRVLREGVSNSVFEIATAATLRDDMHTPAVGAIASTSATTGKRKHRPPGRVLHTSHRHRGGGGGGGGAGRDGVMKDSPLMASVDSEWVHAVHAEREGERVGGGRSHPSTLQTLSKSPLATRLHDVFKQTSKLANGNGRAGQVFDPSFAAALSSTQPLPRTGKERWVQSEVGGVQRRSPSPELYFPYNPDLYPPHHPLVSAAQLPFHPPAGFTPLPAGDFVARTPQYAQPQPRYGQGERPAPPSRSHPHPHPLADSQQLRRSASAADVLPPARPGVVSRPFDDASAHFALPPLSKSGEDGGRGGGGREREEEGMSESDWYSSIDIDMREVGFRFSRAEGGGGGGGGERGRKEVRFGGGVDERDTQQQQRIAWMGLDEGEGEGEDEVATSGGETDQDIARRLEGLFGMETGYFSDED